jgi:hypothetical protein
MEIMKIYKALLVIALVSVIGICSLFYHFGHNDSKALTDFSIAYKNYDRAILDFSITVFASNPKGVPATDDLERNATGALVELNTKASARISSLTRNDAELMSITLEIAYLSGKELDTLKAYQRAVDDKDIDLDKLAKEFGDLTIKRQTNFARFQELAGL